MRKWTQPELVMHYVQDKGSIIPATVVGSPYLDGFFGSETPRACRALRGKGKLTSRRCKNDPRFEEFFLPGQSTLI